MGMVFWVLPMISLCSCLGFGKILSWTTFGYMFGFNETLIGRRYVKIGMDVLF